MARFKHTKKKIESDLCICAFIPPKPIVGEYKLFRALKVEGEKKNARAIFTPINAGIDKALLERFGMHEEIDDLNRLINGATQSNPGEFNYDFDGETAVSGSLGTKIKDFVGAMFKVGNKKRYDSRLNISHMTTTSIDHTNDVEIFLRKCIPKFCDHSTDIRSVFQQSEKNNRWYGGYESIEFGLAFVTTYIEGSVEVREAGTRSGGFGFGGMFAEVFKGNAGLNNDASTNGDYDGRGIVGIRVYFAHLVKENNYPIKIEGIFPVSKSNDKRLKKALDSITAKGFKKIRKGLGRTADSEIMAMRIENDIEEEFFDAYTSLRGLFESNVDITVSNTDQPGCSASLSTVNSNSDDDDPYGNDGGDWFSCAKIEDPTTASGNGILGSNYTNSNNVLY